MIYLILLSFDAMWFYVTSWFFLLWFCSMICSILWFFYILRFFGIWCLFGFMRCSASEFQTVRNTTPPAIHPTSLTKSQNLCSSSARLRRQPNPSHRTRPGRRRRPTSSVSAAHTSPHRTTTPRAMPPWATSHRSRSTWRIRALRSVGSWRRRHASRPASQPRTRSGCTLSRTCSSSTRACLCIGREIGSTWKPILIRKTSSQVKVRWWKLRSLITWYMEVVSRTTRSPHMGISC